MYVYVHVNISICNVISFTRKQLLVFTVVLAIGGILLLKKTNFLLMNGNVLSHLEVLNSNPNIYNNRDLEDNFNHLQHQAHNLTGVTVGDIHSVDQDTQHVQSTSSTKISDLAQDTEALKKHDSTEVHSTITEDAEVFKFDNYTTFVLCYSYWEQQINALINMWSFQKWAHKSGNLKVIEPFAVESVLEFPASKHEFSDTLRFRDYFDLDHWTKETAKLGIKPLVKWESFVKYANRKVIVALPAYGAKPGGIFVDDQINKCEGCKLAKDIFISNTSSLFKSLHFEVIKTVCFAFYNKTDYLTLQKFNSYLLSNNRATIWFGLWQGVASGRILIRDRTLERTSNGLQKILTMVQPSPKIIADSRNYVKTILNSNFRGYTGIIVRSARRYAEMVLKGYSSSEVMKYLTNCVEKLNYVLDKSGSTSYFLGTDIGKFGDRTAYRLDDNDSAKLLQQLLQVVYGNKTIDVYQNEFIKAANGVEDRGYLASMQKTISEQSKCLIVMGGFSTFQRSVVLNYRNGGRFNCVKYVCYEDPIIRKLTPHPINKVTQSLLNSHIPNSVNRDTPNSVNRDFPNSVNRAIPNSVNRDISEPIIISKNTPNNKT